MPQQSVRKYSMVTSLFISFVTSDFSRMCNHGLPDVELFTLVKDR